VHILAEEDDRGGLSGQGPISLSTKYETEKAADVKDLVRLHIRCIGIYVHTLLVLVHIQSC